MASNNQPRRRFAPVPIETTFQSVRKNTSRQFDRPHIGPSAELTPDASPRSPSPVPREFPAARPTRRFAPQLIETSRRTRRAGDAGPATRPTDKTDITPYTKNIYTSTKSKSRRAPHEDEVTRHVPPTRRESEDEGVKEYLLELAAKEAERQIQEAALAAFPNSHLREGGVAHFYFQESSDDDGSQNHTIYSDDDGNRKHRRKSSNLGLGWWHQHMQDHAKQLARDRGELDEEAVFDADIMSDSDLDRMDLSPPPDPLWTTSSRVTPRDRRDSEEEAAAAEAAAFAARLAAERSADSQSSVEDASKQPQPASAEAPAHNPFGGFGRPMGAFKVQPESSAIRKMRKIASPPMLGKDLVFRTCPSPKATRLEPTHAFDKHQAAVAHRDASGNGGLWNGFCCKDETTNGEHSMDCSGQQGLDMLKTPFPPGTPEEMEDVQHVSEEPDAMQQPNALLLNAAQNRAQNGQSNGLHMLHGIDSQLQQMDAVTKRDELIAQEFDDEFVTQVYNYLSLGYPAMALAFDEELSKISHVSVADLRLADEKQMARGHMLEMKLADTPEDERCPRWRALKKYIIEWARQHPDLNSTQLTWGVRERRGSWAI